MADLLNGVAMITWAASGIGQATSVAFVRHGIKMIALLDINMSGLLKTKELLLEQNSDVEVLAIDVNMASEESVVDGVGQVAQRFGSIDIGVNNAGKPGALLPSTELSAQEFREILDVNTVGLWVGQREEIKQMLRQEPKDLGIKHRSRGVIVNLSSIYGINAPSAATPTAPYITSKHAILGLTRNDANCFAKGGIRLNAICPGFVLTSAFKEAVQGGVMESERAKIPLGRFAEPEEIAEAICFLASPMSSYMSGASLIVDG